MEEVISLSENTNELADIMIYQEQSETEFFALHGIPLFPVWEIKNILYQYGEDKPYNYDGSEIQFVIELEEDAHYVLEFGEHGICDAMCLNGEWAGNDDEIKAYLARYNQKATKKNNIECMIYSAAGIIEGGGSIEESELKEIKDAVYCYMKANPASKDILLSYAYSSLQMFVYEDKDLFDIKSLVRRIIQDGCEDSFLDYIRRESCDPNDFSDNGYYIGLVTTALRLIREIKKEATET